MNRLVVDDRWDGNYGIGRYAREVLERLSLPYERAGFVGSPTGVLSILCAHSGRRSPKDALYYSPGYNVLGLSRPQVLTVHDLIHLDLPGRSRLRYSAYYNQVLRPTLRRNRIVVTVSETSRLSIEKWIDDPLVQIAVCGNGCSDEFTLNGAPADFGYPYVLYVGNLKPHKNFAVILDALDLDPDLRLVAVVPRSDKSRLSVGLPDHVSDRVLCVSDLSDTELATLYRGAECLLFPSTIEGFGLPALESLACGSPVVYNSSCLSVREIVGANGVGIPGSDSNNARAWLEGLAGLPKKVSFDRSQYSWDSVAARVSEVLKEHLV